VKTCEVGFDMHLGQSHVLGKWGTVFNVVSSEVRLSINILQLVVSHEHYSQDLMLAHLSLLFPWIVVGD
jgi:hypothetical protein